MYSISVCVVGKKRIQTPSCLSSSSFTSFLTHMQEYINKFYLHFCVISCFNVIFIKCNLNHLSSGFLIMNVTTTKTKINKHISLKCILSHFLLVSTSCWKKNFFSTMLINAGYFDLASWDASKTSG